MAASESITDALRVSSTPSMSRKLGYRPAFDGLRGLAVLAVVIYHLTKVKTWRLLPGGYIGVDVFFVLSGFLITCLLLEEWSANGKIDFKRFYVRRILRLLPALVVCLIVGFALYCFIDPSRWKAGVKQALVVLFYLSNWVRAFGNRSFMGWFGHTWSLSVEEQFYLTWPLLFVFLLWNCRAKPKAALWLLILIAGVMFYRASLSFVGWSYQRLYNGADTRADTLLMGCLGAFCFNGGLLQGRWIVWADKIAIGAGLILVCSCVVTLAPTDPRLYIWGLPLITLIATALIFALAHSDSQSGVVRFLSFKPLVWLGRLSYAIYLWHMVLFSASRELWPDLSLWVRTPLCIALTLVVAWGSFVWIETPFLSLKKRFQSVPHTTDSKVVAN